MRRVTCSASVSLDGYLVGPDGGFAWAAPDEELFASVLEEFDAVGVHLLGRRMYETMRYWDTAGEDPTLGDLELAWAARWTAIPKVVFSRTLSAVQGTRTELAAGGLAEEVARWRAEPGDGDIAVGGAVLVAAAAEAGLLDAYTVRVHPVLVGGGRPYFPQARHQVGLALRDSRTFGSGVVQLRYDVVR